MKILVPLFFLCSSCATATSNNSVVSDANPWSEIKTPSAPPAKSIGTYANGCLAGAQALPLTGVGFEQLFPERNRYYGHPNLIAWIENYARDLNSRGFKIYLGDLSQPRGGKMSSGHASHRIGLDVDIWFAQNRSSVLKADGKVDPAKFGDMEILKLKMAALTPSVERIFVNWAIKVAVCEKINSQNSDFPDRLLEDEKWLRKLRPWPGHHEHYHVRLACPADSTSCISQAAPPPGDGCAEAASWTIPLPNAPAEKNTHQLEDKIPDECQAVIKE